MDSDLRESIRTLAAHAADGWRDQHAHWPAIRALQRSLGAHGHADYWRFISQQQWPQAEGKARTDLSRRTADREAIDRAAVALGKRLSETDRVDDALALVRQRVAQLPTSSQQLDSRVRTFITDQGTTLAEVDATLDSLHNRFLTTPVRDRTMTHAQYAQLRDVHASNVIGIATSMHAFAIARFNRAMANPPSTPREAAELETSLATGYRSLRDASRDGSTRDVLSASTALCTIGRRIAGHALELAVSLESRVPGASVGEIRQHAKAAIEAADLIRAGTLARSVGLQTRWCAQLGEQSEDLIAWRRSAGKLELRSAIREPKTRSIGSLSSNPARYDGEALSIVGRVSTVTNRRIGAGGAKLISTIGVDDGTGRIVDVVLPHIHLDSGGLVPTCWVRISGTWQASSSEHDGKPALEARRLPLGTLAKESFREFSRHRVRTLYEPIAHGLDLAFAWIPGADGPGNQIRYNTMRAAS